MRRYTQIAIAIIAIIIASFAIYIYLFAEGVIPAKPDILDLPGWFVPIILVIILLLLGYYYFGDYLRKMEPIPDWGETELWPTDTRSIVSSVLLAIAFTANMQITERVDAATTGGMLMWLGICFATAWMLVGSTFFGLTGALLVANINPIIAILTATAPLAPSFFLANMLISVPAALLLKQYKQPGEPMSYRTFMTIGIPCGMLSVIPLFTIWVLLVDLAADLILVYTVWGVLMAIPGAFIGYLLCRSIAKSGVLIT